MNENKVSLSVLLRHINFPSVFEMPTYNGMLLREVKLYWSAFCAETP